MVEHAEIYPCIYLPGFFPSDDWIYRWPRHKPSNGFTIKIIPYQCVRLRTQLRTKWFYTVVIARESKTCPYLPIVEKRDISHKVFFGDTPGRCHCRKCRPFIASVGATIV